jgi:hypothetical protein
MRLMADEQSGFEGYGEWSQELEQIDPGKPTCDAPSVYNHFRFMPAKKSDTCLTVTGKQDPKMMKQKDKQASETDGP